MHRSIPQKSLACFTAFVLAFSLLGTCLFQTRPAFAVTEQTEAELTEAQRIIEKTAADYDAAIEELESLEKQIAEAEEKIAELEESLPEQQAKSDDATVALYKMNQEGFSLINMVLGSGSLEEFIASFEYITYIQQTNMNEITRLNTMKSELEESKASLEENRQAAQIEKDNAEAALTEAQSAREEVQRKADEEAAAEAAAAAAAIAAAEAEEERLAAEAAANSTSENQQEQPSTSNNGDSSSNGSGGGSSSTDDIDWSNDKASFVAEWSVRIDNYLAGSPLAGQGKTFAEAAWNYGVDPRFSPAISNTESSKGRYCFKPYNAWGWGSSSWSSWEEAINAHVRGLARGYGYTITVEGAKKYCPNTWEHWYNSTLNQMNMI